jgi:hypothetical protein
LVNNHKDNQLAIFFIISQPKTPETCLNKRNWVEDKIFVAIVSFAVASSGII